MGFFALSLLVAVLLRGNDVALFNPKGLIAEREHQLMVVSTLIMTAFAVAVLFFLYFFAWKYRESNDKSHFNAEAGRSKGLLVTAWISPLLVAIVLAALMLPATQELEPQRSIKSDNEEMTIQVIAMRWKWLFLYPEHDIATVNYVQIPVDTPIRFELTADEAPMNSFWIPHLSGMLYAMTEHVNPLNLIAHTPGDYEGGAAEINGAGFAGMRFTVRVSTELEFEEWARDTSLYTKEFSEQEYSEMLVPSKDNPVAFYSSPRNAVLFDNLLNKYSGSHDHSGAAKPQEHGGH